MQILSYDDVVSGNPDLNLAEATLEAKRLEAFHLEVEVVLRLWLLEIWFFKPSQEGPCNNL